MDPYDDRPTESKRKNTNNTPHLKVNRRADENKYEAEVPKQSPPAGDGTPVILRVGSKPRDEPPHEIKGSVEEGKNPTTLQNGTNRQIKRVVPRPKLLPGMRSNRGPILGRDEEYEEVAIDSNVKMGNSRYQDGPGYPAQKKTSRPELPRVQGEKKYGAQIVNPKEDAEIMQSMNSVIVEPYSAKREYDRVDLKDKRNHTEQKNNYPAAQPRPSIKEGRSTTYRQHESELLNGIVPVLGPREALTRRGFLDGSAFDGDRKAEGSTSSKKKLIDAGKPLLRQKKVQQGHTEVQNRQQDGKLHRRFLETPPASTQKPSTTPASDNPHDSLELMQPEGATGRMKDEVTMLKPDIPNLVLLSIHENGGKNSDLLVNHTDRGASNHSLNKQHSAVRSGDGDGGDRGGRGTAADSSHDPNGGGNSGDLNKRGPGLTAEIKQWRWLFVPGGISILGMFFTGGRSGGGKCLLPTTLVLVVAVIVAWMWWKNKQKIRKASQSPKLSSSSLPAVARRNTKLFDDPLEPDSHRPKESEGTGNDQSGTSSSQHSLLDDPYAQSAIKDGHKYLLAALEELHEHDIPVTMVDLQKYGVACMFATRYRSPKFVPIPALPLVEQSGVRAPDRQQIITAVERQAEKAFWDHLRDETIQGVYLSGEAIRVYLVNTSECERGETTKGELQISAFLWESRTDSLGSIETSDEMLRDWTLACNTIYRLTQYLASDRPKLFGETNWPSNPLVSIDFRPSTEIPRGEWHDMMKYLDEYLKPGESSRNDSKPQSILRWKKFIQLDIPKHFSYLIGDSGCHTHATGMVKSLLIGCQPEAVSTSMLPHRSWQRRALAGRIEQVLGEECAFTTLKEDRNRRVASIFGPVAKALKELYSGKNPHLKTLRVLRVGPALPLEYEKGNTGSNPFAFTDCWIDILIFHVLQEVNVNPLWWTLAAPDNRMIPENAGKVILFLDHENLLINLKAYVEATLKRYEEVGDEKGIQWVGRVMEKLYWTVSDIDGDIGAVRIWPNASQGQE